MKYIYILREVRREADEEMTVYSFFFFFKLKVVQMSQKYVL